MFSQSLFYLVLKSGLTILENINTFNQFVRDSPVKSIAYKSVALAAPRAFALPDPVAAPNPSPVAGPSPQFIYSYPYYYGAYII
ncbi:unnamed protein product [Acanthoscelides obtectus]|uniref:Uncharacterized protein n=1 Tax=Acanthoscelides obtectus TaxID=200917 RepID=A0A9P0L8C7_ACAOB|nr:unnamed protein product [Acanthoscelides obtectus]CAK1652884.1 hypothetical protein AOBTE_LOCUS17955 [Acanthoscelides obtectus]